ncbi:FmdB family zinc ribbon protein [Agrococcus sp. SGAir0287]|uniref:FmdB family zinc ribbon protein n=1 Tax=Agrococcus sp. SGAir0287 TaxID=2070347 RepID=UPI0010CD1A20|nr:FmdB family zinc ribbon protein [Agrococcus sp. SGAir0287]QCR19876.1 FmdB family transcriptional regulator [Agrococcus sp. SGAir0287]
MPVYAYQCTACGTAIEVRQSFTDDALTVCETCGGRLRKRFDAIGVTFKGSGFYRTDSRAGTTGAASGGSGGGSDSGSSSSTAKEAKPSSTSSPSTSSSSSTASS